MPHLTQRVSTIFPSGGPVPISAPVVVLVGPTAVGKTSLSLFLAEHFSAEIVGLDSMQVYRYMDIGTAKPSPKERIRIRHHLIDVVDPDEDYHAARYLEEASAACREIISRGKLPLLVGGTGLYLKGLLDGLFTAGEGGADPAIRSELKRRLLAGGRADLFSELQRCDPRSAERIHPNDSQRLLRALEIFISTGRSWSEHLETQRKSAIFEQVLIIGLNCDRELLYQRINLRIEQMLKEGLLAEVSSLLARGYHEKLKSMQSIGYRHVVNALHGLWSMDEALVLLARDTRRYAKRQLTWFKSDERINWFDPLEAGKIVSTIEGFLRR